MTVSLSKRATVSLVKNSARHSVTTILPDHDFPLGMYPTENLGILYDQWEVPCVTGEVTGNKYVGACSHGNDNTGDAAPSDYQIGRVVIRAGEMWRWSVQRHDWEKIHAVN